ncbi:MAG: tetratricopeptide repeat protein [Sulfuritalea sp.]|nr:tetratricopeptide repeat protein [Sulfuritalea sp.]
MTLPVMAQPAEHPALARWRTRFAEDGAAALSQALAGQISLGSYDRAQPSAALSQILAEPDLARADKSLAHWLGSRLGEPAPDGLTGKRFSDALQEAFRLAALLRLRETRAWCAAHHGDLRQWLRGFYFGVSRDPEGALLAVLAEGQPDRSLLPMWLTIVRRGRPLAHVRHALAGLRLMPADDQGKTERGLPRALLQGLIEYGNALARQGERKGGDWLLEVDFLAAVYPISKDGWGRKFRDVLAHAKPLDTVRNWLDQRYPLALKAQDGKTAHGPTKPRHVDDLKKYLQQVETHFEEVKPQLQKYFDDSRHYCRESGDSFYLVRSFCYAGDRLLKVDPAWARDLAHEAAVWAPNNHNCWSVLARALETEGDWRRAEAVFWQARRRFPENDKSHNQLGHALLLHGQAELGEAVYRQAIRLFPDNPFCRADLGNTLRILGRTEEALAVYLQAQGEDLFHRNIVIANSIADILIDLNRLDEAEDALVWGEQVLPSGDAKSERHVAAIRTRLKNAQSGQAIILKKLRPRPEIIGGSLAAFADITGSDFSLAPTLGQATLLRRKANGGLARAGDLIANLPDGPEKMVEHGLWLAAAEGGWPAAAGYYDQVWKRFEGDGVLRVHRQRAHARTGANVDWELERKQYPELASVILAEEIGRVPAVSLSADEDERSQEQIQDAWFADLVGRNDAVLKDLAEEDYLAARHGV